MHIEFVYHYTWNDEDRAYYVIYDYGTVTVRQFTDQEIGALVNPVPSGRMTEIQAHIDSTIEGLSSFFPSVPEV